MSHIAVFSNLHIPVSEIVMTYCTSSGPGGQHVNKANTKVVLHWNVYNAQTLSERQRGIILHKLKNRISAKGDIILTEDGTRSQNQNRRTVIVRLTKILQQAFYTAPIRKKTVAPRRSKRKRLNNKKARGHVKKPRAKGSYLEE